MIAGAMDTGPEMPGGRLVIFTDLDGTLLDARTYSFGPASGALELLRAHNVPLVVCTSKTRAEILYWRKRLGNTHPFVSENGGAVFIPDGYFKQAVPGASLSDGYLVLKLGTPYAELRRALVALRAEGFDVRGFGDMSPEEVAAATGLPAEQARMAMERDYDEPFYYHGDAVALPRLFAAITRMGLKHTSGRLLHILGDNDKGRAVRLLAGLYGGGQGGVITAAIGDSPNDAPMLDAVDFPFLVRKPEGGHDTAVTGPKITRVEGAGPEGWAEAVEGLLDRLGIR